MKTAILIIWVSSTAITSQKVTAEECEVLAAQARDEGLNAKCLYCESKGDKQLCL